MKNLLSICLLTSIFLLTACESDQDRQNDFVGTYEVTIDSPGAKRELKQAKKDMQADIEEAREEIREDMRDAREDIEQEFGEDSGLGRAIGNFVEGVGEVAANLTHLGESLSNLGIDIGTSVLGDVRFNAEFQSDGEVKFGKKRGLRITANDLRWKIKDGDLYLWDDEEGEAKAERFDIKNISENEWDLVGKDVTFHLKLVE